MCWLPEVDAFSVGQDREGSTQRSLGTDQHDPATQTRTHTHISGSVVVTVEYFYMCKKTGMNLVIIVEQQPRETEK